MKLAQIKAVVERHAPPGWEEVLPFDQVLKRLSRPKYAPSLPMVVLCADISGSTRLLMEAKRVNILANNLRDLFDTILGAVIRPYGGWFDKFMGDGLLAYWPCPDGQFEEATELALKSSLGIGAYFTTNLPKLVAGKSQEEMPPPDLYFGVAAGDVQLLMVAKDLTIFGMPVVTATRFAGLALPGETLCGETVAKTIKEAEDSWLGHLARVAEYDGEMEKQPKAKAFRVTLGE